MTRYVLLAYQWSVLFYNSVHGMQRDSCIGFFIIAKHQSLIVGLLNAHNPWFTCGIWVYFADTSQQLGQPRVWRVCSYKNNLLQFVAIFPCSASVHLITSSFSFCSCWPVYVKYNACPSIHQRKVRVWAPHDLIYSWKSLMGKVDSSNQWPLH